VVADEVSISPPIKLPHAQLTTINLIRLRYNTAQHTTRQCTQHPYGRASPHDERMWKCEEARDATLLLAVLSWTSR
jgi:hypothetical protein